jgi:hypothetical protein
MAKPLTRKLIGGLAAIVLSVFVYTVFFVEGPREASVHFLDDLIDKNWMAAFDRTIPEERERMGMTREQFGKLMAGISQNVDSISLRPFAAEELPLPYNPPRPGIKCYFVTFPKLKAKHGAADMIVYAHRTGDGWKPSLANIHLAFLGLASRSSKTRWTILRDAMEQASLDEVRSSSDGGYIRRSRIEMYLRGEIQAVQIQTQHAAMNAQ